MTRGIVGCVLLTSIVASLGIAGARGAASDRPPAPAATATTGACAGLPDHDAL